jgi:hypothetical protein
MYATSGTEPYADRADIATPCVLRRRCRALVIHRGMNMQFPRRTPSSSLVRCRIVWRTNASSGCGHPMAEVLERALDPRAAPARILRRHAHHQTPNFDEYPRSPWSPPVVPPFPRNQFAMPSKNGVGRHERRHVAQHGASQPSPEQGEAAALSVGQPQRPPANCAFSARLSSRKKAITSRCSRSSHPSTATRSMSGRTRTLYATWSSSEFSDSTAFPRLSCRGPNNEGRSSRPRRNLLNARGRGIPGNTRLRAGTGRGVPVYRTRPCPLRYWR